MDKIESEIGVERVSNSLGASFESKLYLFWFAFDQLRHLAILISVDQTPEFAAQNSGHEVALIVSIKSWDRLYHRIKDLDG